MPLYYFDIKDGPDGGRDEDGMEFPDLETARATALRTLGEIAKDELPDGDCRDFHISIRDERGAILLKATLSLKVEQT